MNTDITTYLGAIAKERKEAEKNYNAGAYVRAITEIKKLNFRLTADYLRNNKIPYVGPGITEKILYFLGEGPEVEGLPNLSKEEIEKQKILNEFKSVWRCGNACAEKWYNAGYKSIYQIPKELMTEAQEVYIQFYDQLRERIPRNETEKFESFLKKHLQTINPNNPVQFIIAGSYLRGKETSGDIDILTIKIPGRDVANEILSFEGFIYTLSLGSDKYNGIGGVSGIARRIDIEFATPEEYPFELLYFTGSGNFNRKMRAHAKSLGYDLNQKGLINLSTGEHIRLNSEREIFAYLDYPYLPPSQRE